MNVKLTVGLTAGSILLLSAGQLPRALAADASVASDTDQVSAIVETVDLQARHVLLRGPTGVLLTVEVPPGVKNLAQVEPGDRLTVRYRDALAVRIVQPGEATPAVPAQATTRNTTAPSDLSSRSLGTAEATDEARL